ncbi:MAG: DndE family protein [Myxococcales bacterium]|nr:DndE family protein [Myxococcales bacterium]
MDDFTLGRIDKKGYKPTREADEFLEQLRRSLVTGERYRVARLALGYSLATPGEVPLVPRGTEMGSPIEGAHLFGDDTGIWACLIAERASLPVETAEVFRQLVEAHWMRGARLLKAEYEAVGGRDAEFAARLALLAEAESDAEASGNDARIAPLRLVFGETGLDLLTQQPYEWTMNEPTGSPHALLVGDVESRERALAVLAERLHGTETPILWLDPSGRLVRDGAAVAVPSWGGRSIADRLPGATVIDLASTPLPLDLFATAADRTVLGRLMGEALARALRGREGTAEAVQAAIEALPKKATLKHLPERLREANEQLGRKRDAVEGRLTEVAALPLFEAKQRPDRFWSKSWIVGISGLSDDARRAVIALLAASLVALRREAGRSPEDARGFWQLSQAVVVADGSEFFGMGMPAVAEMMVRGRALGLAVLGGVGAVLDLGAEGDEALGRVGALGSFALPLPVARQLRDAFGKRLTVEQLGERDLPPGVILLRDGRRDPVRVEVWR